MPDTPARPTLPLKPLDAIILQLVARGDSNVHIAHQVQMSKQGVEYRISQLLRRFSVENRAELVAWAYHLGLFQAGVWPPRVRPGAIDDGTRPVPGRRGSGRAVTDLPLPQGGAA